VSFCSNENDDKLTLYAETDTILLFQPRLHELQVRASPTYLRAEEVPGSRSGFVAGAAFIGLSTT
jgi:hypothetical protein